MWDTAFQRDVLLVRGKTKMDLNTLGVVVGLGLLGGLIRTIRDTYKRYLNDKKNFIDRIDVFFDLVFGVIAGSLAWLTITEGSFTKAVVLSVLTAAYAGADIIDGILNRKA